MSAPGPLCVISPSFHNIFRHYHNPLITARICTYSAGGVIRLPSGMADALLCLWLARLRRDFINFIQPLVLTFCPYLSRRPPEICGLSQGTYAQCIFTRVFFCA